MSIAFYEKRSGTKAILIIVCFSSVEEFFSIEALPVKSYLMFAMVRAAT